MPANVTKAGRHNISWPQRQRLARALITRSLLGEDLSYIEDASRSRARPLPATRHLQRSLTLPHFS